MLQCILLASYIVLLVYFILKCQYNDQPLLKKIALILILLTNADRSLVSAIQEISSLAVTMILFLLVIPPSAFTSEPAPAAPVDPAVAATNAVYESTESRLRALKQAYENGIISEEAYLSRKQEILDSVFHA